MDPKLLGSNFHFDMALALGLGVLDSRVHTPPDSGLCGLIQAAFLAFLAFLRIFSIISHILTNKHRIVFEVELIDKCHLN